MGEKGDSAECAGKRQPVSGARSPRGAREDGGAGTGRGIPDGHAEKLQLLPQLLLHLGVAIHCMAGSLCLTHADLSGKALQCL